MINKQLLASSPQAKKPIVLLVTSKLVHLIVNIAITYQLLLALLSHDIAILVTPIFIGSCILKVIVPYVQTMLTYRIAESVSTHLRSEVLSSLLHNPQAKNKLTSSEWAQLTTEGIEHIEVYFSNYIPQFFYSMIAPIFLLISLAQVNLGIALVLFVGVPLIPLSIIAVQRFAKKLLNKYWSKYTGLGNSFLENLESLTTLKLFNIDEQAQVKMDEEAETFRKMTMRVLIMQLNSISVMDLVAYAGSMLAIVLSVIAYQNARLEIFGVLLFCLLSAEFFIPMRQLGSFFHVAMNGQAASDLLNRALSVYDEPLVDTPQCDHTKGFEVTSLSVIIDKTNILDSISLTLKPKESIGLVGPSGAGKSMLVAAMLGKVTLSSGKASFGGTKINPDAIHDVVSLVPAQPKVFKGSIQDNLEMGYHYSQQDMLQVLKSMNLEQFNLDDKVLERGENLSGGERQRLALARALLKNTDYYIFDEATANIDVESEAIINAMIDTLKDEGKGIIYVSHRLKNVEHMDTILVLDQGVCVEKGRHVELMANQGIYQAMVTEQNHLETYAYMEEKS